MKLISQALPSSESFKANEAAHLAALQTIREAADAAELGGGEKSRARHVSRGKMLPRERVANLLDPGSPFLEVGALAAHLLLGQRREVGAVEDHGFGPGSPGTGALDQPGRQAEIETRSRR